MLSIGAMAKGQGRYYLDLAREDYYLEGGEPPGQWRGEGAQHLGLKSQVKKEDLQKLLAGFAPDGTPLIQNAGHEKHQPGWDLTFSAPKSVSVLWSLADPAMRAQIQELHDAAVQAALRFIEQEATFSRRGKGGAIREKAGLIVATFEHGTSRALDPQLHTHALVVNIGVRSDGTTGTLLSKPFYKYKMAAGAVYRAEFAHLLTSVLGLMCRAVKSWFEIEGIPESLIREFSKRREQIKKELKTKNLETASAAAAATLKTREAKDNVPPREELFRKWQETGRGSGFDFGNMFGRRSASQTEKPPNIDDLLKEALAHITREHNFFSEKELIKAVAERAQTGAYSAEQIREGVKAALNDPKRIVPLGNYKTHPQFTTPEVLALEKQMLDHAAILSKRGHGVSASVAKSIEAAYGRERSAAFTEAKYHARQLGRAARNKSTKPINRSQVLKDLKNKLTREQLTAFRHLTKRGKGALRVLEGLAGTGKSFLFRAVREAYEKAGYRVLGVTVSGKAARELQSASGIRTITIAGLQFWMQHPLRHKLSHHLKQILLAAIGGEMKRFKFDKKTVLIIDEASMVSTQSLAAIIRDAKRGGGLLILSGDRVQIPAIERGGAFAHLADVIGKAFLNTIVRQRHSKDRENVTNMAKGNVHDVLTDLAQRGLLTVMPNRDKAKEELVKAWSHHERLARDKSLILCGTNAESDEINRRCQKARCEAGELDDNHSIRLKDLLFHQDDRIVFLKNSRPLGICNGDMATITSINPVLRRITAKLDNGSRVVVPLYNYEHIALGYAATTHKGQGTTVENAYILAGGSMQYQELSYVQLSRARGTTRVFTDERQAGPDLSQLARQMSESREKRLATAILKEQEPSFSRSQL